MATSRKISRVLDFLTQPTGLLGLVGAPPASGKVLTSTGTGVSDYGWDDPPAGPGGSQEVYVQAARPSAAGPWVWWQTEGGQVVDLIVNDGS